MLQQLGLDKYIASDNVPVAKERQPTEHKGVKKEEPGVVEGALVAGEDGKGEPIVDAGDGIFRCFDHLRWLAELE